MSTVPRPEYPRMQFRREAAWMNLNGEWDFLADPGQSGRERRVFEHPEAFNEKIMVPFVLESRLSGLGRTDFIESVFYQREITVPETWRGRRIFLNFGAVDYRATVWLDGVEAGCHVGGSSSFSVELTGMVKWGEAQRLVVQAMDELRSGTQGGGKQSSKYGSYGCYYTRTTGIWQTVWLEAVADGGLRSCRISANPGSSQVVFSPCYFNAHPGDALRITVRAAGRVTGQGEFGTADGIPCALTLSEVRLWNTTDPFLYDVELEVCRDGRVIDAVASYFGMRTVTVSGGRILLNGRPVFQRLVLDQGFYPDGLWTAPSDAELRADIERSMAAGFNGARLHQKVFEERFHYWADRLGYLTWAEYPSWGIDLYSFEAKQNFLREWQQVVERDVSHPSIIAWTPLNETAKSREIRLGFVCDEDSLPLYREFIEQVYDLTKALDPSRPVNDCSGYFHIKTDLWTIHPYVSTGEELKQKLHPEGEPVFRQGGELETGYRGQPYLVDEWGGFKYIPPANRTGTENGWGYHGLNFRTPEELLARIDEQIEVMIADPAVAGACYTQLTDVEQEQNGLYLYNRTPKLAPERFRAVFGKKPAWSEE